MKKETPEEKRERVLAKLNSEIDKCDIEIKRLAAEIEGRQRGIETQEQMKKYHQQKLDQFLNPTAEENPAPEKRELKKKK